ncbi:hypothetical protein N8723_03855 [Luminiphilus sp.]|nr:hypothetical protein [Luminiphilus sp.]
MKETKVLLGLAAGAGIASRLGNVFAWFGFALLVVGATTFPILGVGAIWETQIQEKPVWGSVESCADVSDDKQKIADIDETLESDPSKKLTSDQFEWLDRMRLKYSSFDSDLCEEWTHARHSQFKDKSGWRYGGEVGLSGNYGLDRDLGYVSWFARAFPISLLTLASWLVIILLNYLLWGAARILPWKRAVPEATES